MAKKSTIEKNSRRMRLALHYAAKRKELKAIIMNRTLPLEERFEAQLKLTKMPRNGIVIRVRNRCELTGRSRAYYRKFKLSRISLRSLAARGMLPGVIKASW